MPCPPKVEPPKTEDGLGIDDEQENPVTDTDLIELRDHINSLLARCDEGKLKNSKFLPCYKVEVHRK